MARLPPSSFSWTLTACTALPFEFVEIIKGCLQCDLGKHVGYLRLCVVEGDA